ncbi:MAG: sulfotransferase [Alcanivoracaceae bacterium]|nr:sulfotransferase [Alcanivoracaceae bacterium]
MTRFVFTGFPRTGTTVVAGSIISHPEILFYGEVLNNQPEVRQGEARRETLSAGWRISQAPDHPLSPCSLYGSGRAYLEQLYGQAVPHKAIGFKLMHDQAISGPNSDAWDYLLENTDIKLIRTTRQNPLEILCSFVRASLTRHWHNTGQDVPQHRFVVPPDQAEALLTRFLTMPAQLEQMEKSHAMLELDYGRICSDFSGCMRDVFDFLGVSPMEVDGPRLKKIAQIPPEQELANYSELAAHFRDTRFGQYFNA